MVEPGEAFEVRTSRGLIHDIIPLEHPLNERYSNGSFLVDVDSEGVPVSMNLKELDSEILNNK